MHLVVLGGGGAMGRITVRALVEDARVKRVTVADLSEPAPQRTIDWLAQRAREGAASGCDVRDAAGAGETARCVDAVLNATDYPFNLRCHAGRTGRPRLLCRPRRPLSHDAGSSMNFGRRFPRGRDLTAVLGIGSTPGITNILARLAADQLDRIERLDVRIGSA